MPSNMREEDGFQVLSRLLEKKGFGYLCESNTKKNETLANFPSYLFSAKGRKTRFNPSIQYSTHMQCHGKTATSLPTHVLY